MSMYDRADPYTENPYDSGYQDRNRLSTRNGTSAGPTELASSWTVVTRFSSTIMLRIGFALVQVGSVPVTNVNLILLQNVVDFSCVTLIYALGGHVIAYGGDVHGLMGEGHWIGQVTTNEEEAVVGWQAIVTASAISTSCLVGRTHTVGYLLIGIIMAGVLQPFFIHWAWTPKGWMARNSLHDRIVSFRDYGGSAVVHTVGGITGMMGCVTLGRRILRLRDIDDASVSADSASTSFAGYLLILLGLQSLCMPSTSASHSTVEDRHTSLIVMNNLLGASVCSLVVIGLHFFPSREPFNHWTVMRCVQSSVAGMVVVSAGVDVYTPIMCVGLGFFGGIVFYLMSRLIFQSALEDYCNIVATHLTCAIFGNIVAAFCRNFTSPGYDAGTTILNVVWQVICLVAIVTLVTIVMTAAFVLLECFGLLRNRSEFVNHLRAVVALERGPPRSYMQRLFYPDSETVYLQPGTAPVQRLGSPTSQRFARYENPMVDLDNSTSNKLVDTTRRSSQPETSPSFEFSNHVFQTRIKKLRQVHTITSTSLIDVSAVADHVAAMGDNRNIHFDANASVASRENTRIRCSGDVADEPSSNDDSSPKFAIFNRERFDTTIGIIANEQREPYRLHRTEKFMNLRMKPISEHDENVEFLVKPRSRSFSSTESESEEEVTTFATSIGQSTLFQNSKMTIHETAEFHDT